MLYFKNSTVHLGQLVLLHFRKIICLSLAQASSPSGVFPCFTSSPLQKLWSPERSRWLLATEKGACMGFPTTSAGAKSYGCQPLIFNDIPDGHAAIGNSMHVPNVAMILATVLLSVKLYETYCFSSLCFDQPFINSTV